MDKEKFLLELKCIKTEGKTVTELYNEISALAMKYGCADVKAVKNERRASYFSIEFLIGRSFYNNLMELGVLNDVKAVLEEKDFDINSFEEIEDAALGNGGLGRLAACFLDSAAGTGIPLDGYGIRYKYGLFKQDIRDGFQVELPDDWQRFGDPWSIRRDDEKILIKFADMSVYAVPYDMPVFGKRVNVLRLYQAEGDKEAEKISEYLYPSDDTEEGKLLRLRQEYFFSAAAIKDLCKRYVKEHGTQFKNFYKYNVIQLNDTHPVIAIAEFIRLLTSEYHETFTSALKIAKKTFAYTNHTIMPEALECWKEVLVDKILPEISDIIKCIAVIQDRELNEMLCDDEEISEMAIYKNGIFNMANLAVYVCKSVNGVAKLHTNILKKNLFRTAYEYYPDKFNNKTNGVTHRRWLELCDEELAAMIDNYIGDGWRHNIAEINHLNNNIEAAVSDFQIVKKTKKAQLIKYINSKEGTDIDENMLVYAQVKRLHEYKRQLMTVFAILEIYYGLKEGTIKDFYPSVFIFGAKSAPSYKAAKAIIKFINEIAAKINSDNQTNKILKVVFVTDYNVSYAEKIVAGTDVSLQVSTAGTEASGTGNMKFMMNGAVTCGIMDGANIEIVDRAGKENNYIFGAGIEDIERMKKTGYDPTKLLKNPAINNVVNSLIDGRFSDDGTGCFKELYESLIKGESWHKPDNYFVLLDLQPYVQTLLKVNNDYKDSHSFTVKQLKNIANSAYFSSDRTIKEYADDIWFK